MAAPGNDHSLPSQGRQASTDDDPLPALYVPAGQSWHASVELDAPVVGLYVPGGQGLRRDGECDEARGGYHQGMGEGTLNTTKSCPPHQNTGLTEWCVSSWGGGEQGVGVY
jgi:hypothetical protein